MNDPRLERLADVLIDHSTRLAAGEVVLMECFDLPEPTLHDFWVALAWVRERHGLGFYSLVARNGACEFTGGTVRHVHIHLIQGDVEDPDHQPVRVKISSHPPS